MGWKDANPSNTSAQHLPKSVSKNGKAGQRDKGKKKADDRQSDGP